MDLNSEEDPSLDLEVEQLKTSCDNYQEGLTLGCVEGEILKNQGEIKEDGPTEPTIHKGGPYGPQGVACHTWHNFLSFYFIGCDLLFISFGNNSLNVGKVPLETKKRDCLAYKSFFIFLYKAM